MEEAQGARIARVCLMSQAASVTAGSRGEEPCAGVPCHRHVSGWEQGVPFPPAAHHSGCEGSCQMDPQRRGECTKGCLCFKQT